jgi:NADH-quinone oxidoreductase subunit L
MAITTFAWLVLLLPLLGSVIIALGYRWMPGKTAGWLGTAAIAIAFALSVATLISLLGHHPDHRQVTSSLWNYDFTAGVDARMQILVDPLSVFMILTVSGVSALIHLYSVAYLWEDAGYRRYFSYLNFFVFSMLLLVLAGNFVILIVGWAFVGAASYLLISFWYRRNTATRAGLKAFLINVVGDVGLVLGTFFLFKHTGTVDFLRTFARLPHVFHTDSPDLVAAGILLLVGAFAKSAQFPLHTWLPDAMEGPTPVSALIHAATMVTAGVYLIARMHPIYELAPTAADVGIAVGAFTLLLAGSIALVVTDLKRVIAYSTMSQIGYMIMGVSAGAYAAGMFHLMTHAFFKALLFMAAGSLIGAMAGVQSMDRMGGFRKAMPFTFACFVIGGLALSGMPPFSGWLSKDDIIGYLQHRGNVYVIVAVVGYVGAFLTALYTFRMIFRVFLGEPVPEARSLMEGHLAHADVPRNPMTGEEEDTDVGFPGPGHFIAEREILMKVAMGTLAVLAIIGGFVQLPGVDDVVGKFLAPSFAGSKLAHVQVPTGNSWIGLVVGALIALAGIGLAYRIWVVQPGIAVTARQRLSGLYQFLSHKWYMDEVIDLLVVRPALWFGRLVDFVLERTIIGGVVTGAPLGVVRAGSVAVRRVQTGYLRYYAAGMVICMTGVAAYFLIAST